MASPEGPRPNQPRPTRAYGEVFFGWLSPDGLLYACADGEHSTLAERLLGRPLEDDDWADEALQECGWLKLATRPWPSPYSETETVLEVNWFGEGVFPRPTSYQRRTIADWSIAHEVPASLSVDPYSF